MRTTPGTGRTYRGPRTHLGRRITGVQHRQSRTSYSVRWDLLTGPESHNSQTQLRLSVGDDGVFTIRNSLPLICTVGVVR